MRLGQAESAEHLALRQRREPVALLLGIAVAQQDGVDRAVGHADRRAGAAVAGSNLFQHQCQGQVVQPGSAQFFRYADAVGAQSRQALVCLFGEVVLLVPACGVGPQLLPGKVAHRVADHFLVLGQQHEIGLRVFFTEMRVLGCCRMWCAAASPRRTWAAVAQQELAAVRGG